MSGIAVMGASEHDVRDFPGVYTGNLCGLRSSISAGGSGLVVNPICIPGATYEDIFVSPLTGEFVSRIFIRETISGTSAVLYVEVDGVPVGQLDLLTLEADTPTEIDFGGATVEGGESLITVRIECSDDVSPGAGLTLTLGGIGEDMTSVLTLPGRRNKKTELVVEPVP